MIGDVFFIDIKGDKLKVIEDLFYIHMFGKGFRQVCGYSFDIHNGLHLGVHYGDMPYGSKYDYNVWHKWASGKCWVVSDKWSGNAIGVSGTMEQATEHAMHMIELVGGVEKVKELANKSIAICGIAPGYLKTNRY